MTSSSDAMVRYKMQRTSAKFIFQSCELKIRVVSVEKGSLRGYCCLLQINRPFHCTDAL